jgi:integrase
VQQSSDAISKYVNKISEGSENTGYQYLKKLQEFERFITQNYHFNIDELTITKTFVTDIYKLLSNYVTYLVTKNNISNLTIKQRVTTVRNFLEYYDFEISPRKFKLKVKIPKPVRRHKEALSKEDITKILETCSNIKLKSFLMFLAVTGCRAMEGCSIQLSDIDFNKYKVNIRGEFTKTKEDRYVFLTEELCQQLKLWLNYKYRTRTIYLREKRKNHYFTPIRNGDDLVFSSDVYGKTDKEDLNGLYTTLLIQFEKTMDELQVGYEDASKRRRKITLHSFRRYTKSAISDLGYADFSEWVIGHAGSTYYRKNEFEKYKLFKKIEPYLTFLDWSGLERKGADLSNRLETMERENVEMKTRYEQDIKQLNEKLMKMDKAFQKLVG